MQNLFLNKRYFLNHPTMTLLISYNKLLNVNLNNFQGKIQLNKDITENYLSILYKIEEQLELANVKAFKQTLKSVKQKLNN
jgi:hypothetical protein